MGSISILDVVPKDVPSLDRRIRNVLMCTFVHFGTSGPLDLRDPRDLMTLGGYDPGGDGDDGTYYQYHYYDGGCQ